MNGERVGSWSLTPTGDELRYDEDWLASPQGRPLSLSMPFQPGNLPYRGAVVRAFFDNLLPDSAAIRQRIAQRFGVPSSGAFDLLAEVGRDCAGALYIAPPHAPPSTVRSIEATPLEESDVAELLRDIAETGNARHPGNDRYGLRLSIAGAQEKTALLWDEGRWWMPTGTTPTTHILKLPLGRVGHTQLDLSDSVDNEWLCARIIEAFGLPVARCHPLQFEDQRVLAVERFDRRWMTGDAGAKWLVRLPQEDMCQASGTPAEFKYESDGGPGMDAVLTLLNASSLRVQDRQNFFRAQFLFWLLCAPDGHAKNFSVAIHPRGRFALTPLYDVMSAYPLLGAGRGRLSPHRVRMAMAVRAKNAHWRMGEILRRHWLAVGKRNGVVGADGGDADSMIQDMVERAGPAMEAVGSLLPSGFPEALFAAVRSGVLAASCKMKVSP